jgi:S-(hydroxymethyl)glutathione dehydrogenase/alcohol dehydrogenase
VAAMLGCAVATGVGAALYTAKIVPGDTVVVIGVGAVGLNVVQGARLAQASVVVAVDPESGSHELARRLGATHTISPKDNDLVAQVRDLTSGRGVEHVFEVVGNPRTMAQAIDLLARGGALTLVGAANRDILLSFAPRRFMSQQQTIRGCIYGNIHPSRDLPLFAQWYLDGRLEIDALLGDRITLAQVPDCFAANAGATRRGIRTIVEFS